RVVAAQSPSRGARMTTFTGRLKAELRAGRGKSGRSRPASFLQRRPLLGDALALDHLNVANAHRELFGNLASRLLCRTPSVLELNQHAKHFLSLNFLNRVRHRPLSDTPQRQALQRFIHFTGRTSVAHGPFFPLPSVYSTRSPVWR